jgi:hypothetical protein
MTPFGSSGKYHIELKVQYASGEKLERWAQDENCIERAECERELVLRRLRKTKEEEGLSVRKQGLEANPFDFRKEHTADSKEVSADARYIVKHLWIIFVLLPFVLGLVYAILNAITR